MTERKLITFVKDEEIFHTPDILPVLPLRDVVVFPYMVIPLMVGRPSSVSGIESAMLADRLILLEILPFYKTESKELEALTRKAISLFDEYVKLNPRLPDELLTATQNVDSPLRLGYIIGGHVLIRMDYKQDLLESDSLLRHFQLVCQYLRAEMEILRLERKIDNSVKKQIFKNQREFYLQEQLKAIHKELGQEEDGYDEIEELKGQTRKKNLPADVGKKAEKEISKLARMSMMSPEATVIRNYLDWILSLPWRESTGDELSVDRVARTLDEDHHGLVKPKERIVEFIAVSKLVGELKGPILCFVGPPGVGKTSLGKSVARALGRKLVRLSVGGVRDEAEIRGHRRTYIGAMPGKIIQAMKRAGVINPVILIDEIDKMSSDFRGDPSSALLEVLDPEQNSQFVDHYLEVDYDLSKVMFITTANYAQNVPDPLKDRMEIIALPGYLHNEKIEIARKFLLPKQVKAHGLKPQQLEISQQALNMIIENYTREAGVRNLERELGAICRKAARRIASRKKVKLPIRVTPGRLKKYLGVPRFVDTELETVDQVGLANGLAWTGAGGSVLHIEVAPVAGKGKLMLTGKLGEVMKESAEAALSYVRSRYAEFGLEPDFYQKIDLHVHVPEGATPKDGPSAGVAIATAVVSAMAGIPVRRDVAMTGEITLRGRVLPVGGLNEKTVAALRAGVKRVIWPLQNKKDLDDLPREVREGIEVSFVETIDEVLKIALAGPVPARAASEGFIAARNGESPNVQPYRH